MEIDQKKDTETNGVVNVWKERYIAGYLKNGIIRGITYQMKMLTWVAWKLTFRNDMNDWLLAAEVRNARGFHDLVLKYKINKEDESTPQYMYRFMQIKLKISNLFQINKNTLTSMQKNLRQFSLIYLFKAYLNIITNFEKVTPQQIKDLIIFTNGSIGMSIKFLVPVDEDEVIGFQGKGKQYRIDINMILAEQNIMKSLRQHCSRDQYDHILDFLKKVVFMVDQPSEPELEELITKEISKIFHIPQIFYNDLYKNMTEWFLIYENDGMAPYLMKQHVKYYLENTKKMLLDARKTKTLFVDDSSSELTNKLECLFL